MLGSLCLSPMLGAQLLDNFEARDGRGVTYSKGPIAGQSGGSGWAAGSVWEQGGRTISAEIHRANVLSFSARNPGQNQSAIRHIWRQYERPDIPLRNKVIRTTVQLNDLRGFRDMMNESGVSTSSSSQGQQALDYFAIFPRQTAGSVLTSAMWYVEASAGYWRALPGGKGNLNFAPSVQVAPLVEGEMYQIDISFSGRNTWAVTIRTLNSNETFSSGWLEYIGAGNTDSDLSNFISFRAVADQNDLPHPVEIWVHDVAILSN